MKWRAKSKLARPGKVLGDRYRLEAPLGHGAMGEIWRAEHLRLKSQVAIKFLDSAIADDPEMLNRFFREAQSAAAVRSPHVVQIFDCGVERGAPYISMELLQGQTLEARLNERLRLTPAELSQIFGEVALAVSKAHEVGVVHRDLKPSNIFLAREGEREITKVLDFGIAKVVSHTSTQTGGLTVTGTLLGTPHYMSPEQARGSREVDFRSDLWSLAIIAFECLTGQQPFSGRALGELVVQICTEEPRMPSSFAAVPSGFDEWFRTGTSKDPSQRFASAREMADALSAILASSAVQDSPMRVPAGTPGASDSLRSVTVPLGRPAVRESWSGGALSPAAHTADVRGSLAQSRTEPRRPSASPPALAAQLIALLRRARRTVVQGRRRPTGLESPPTEAGKPLASLRPLQRWLVPASLLLGASILLGASRWLWWGTSRPAPVLAGERTTLAAPPARPEHLQAPQVRAASTTTTAALPGTPSAERGAASPADHEASPADETASPASESAGLERETPPALVAEPAPVAPQPAIARVPAPSSSPARRPSKPAAPARPAVPKARPVAEAAPPAHAASPVAEPAAPPRSKRQAVDPFAERL